MILCLSGLQTSHLLSGLVNSPISLLLDPIKHMCFSPREKEIFYLLVHSPLGCNSQGLARLKPGDIWISHVGGIGHPPLLSQGQQQGARLEVAQMELKLIFQDGMLAPIEPCGS